MAKYRLRYINKISFWAYNGVGKRPTLELWLKCGHRTYVKERQHGEPGIGGMAQCYECARIEKESDNE
jgi:hypothetical protein